MLPECVTTHQSGRILIDDARHIALPLGVIVRRTPGVTRWAKYAWRAVAVLPGAAQADWQLLREEGDAAEFHAATVPLDLHAADAEAYLHGLHSETPSIYVILRETTDERPLEVVLATASPYEGQDYADNGDDIVEKVPMPPQLRELVEAFADDHYVHEDFIKRKRDKKRIDLKEDGKGDPRIHQLSDVYRAPGSREKLN
ncbi:DUF3305 domain-containing protein [Primorskyibacter aestuariivivens]|uniref:DUF3305 domain-containing protein n=1 Tax=Primorskyibacter aestuariivivens TaxID=1888912 RepID=UPI002FE3CA72